MNLEDLDVLTTMASIYYTVHIFDLANDTLIPIKAEGLSAEVGTEGGNAADKMAYVMENTVVEEYKERVLEFTNINTVAQRIKGKTSIAEDFLGKNVGWIKAQFIVLTQDENGTPTSVVYTTQIVNDQKHKEHELLVASQIDGLTGLYNRKAYEDDIRFYPDVPPEDNFVYVSIDVNGLKNVNDSLGHKAGDELLIGAANCMKRCLGSYGKLYRTGGDEFAAILFADNETLAFIIQDLDASMDSWHGESVNSLSMSVGCVGKSEFPNASVTEMAQMADSRMYQAKTNYYKTKGVDLRIQKAVFGVLCDTYIKVLQADLTNDTFTIIRAESSEQTPALGYSDRFSAWLYNLAMCGLVYYDDCDEYLTRTDINYLRAYFASGQKNYRLHYRRLVGNEYRQVLMEMIPELDYTNEHQKLLLCVKIIE
ncbi:MAG: GGDEF domain-containing protein [Oscillospiraceae bacterium]